MPFSKTEILREISTENYQTICELLESLKFQLAISMRGETDTHSRRYISMVLAEVWGKSRGNPELFAALFAGFCQSLLHEGRKSLTALLLAVAIGEGYLHADLVYGLEKELAQKVRTILAREQQNAASVLHQVAAIFAEKTLFSA